VGSRSEQNTTAQMRDAESERKMWESQYGKFGRKSPAADATSYERILTFVCFEGEKTDGHLTQFTK